MAAWGYDQRWYLGLCYDLPLSLRLLFPGKLGGELLDPAGQSASAYASFEHQYISEEINVEK